MEKDIIFDSSYCTVKFDSEKQWIWAEWRGYQTLDQIQRGMQEGYLQAISSRNCGKIIADLRQGKGTFTVANSWIAKDWYPQAFAAGFRKCAMIYSKDVFIKFAMQDLNRKYEKANVENFKMRYFDDVEEAIQWMKEETISEENL